MDEADVAKLLEDTGAVLRGHFRLSSGRHSDVFIQKFRVFEHPEVTGRLGAGIANLFEGNFDLVVAPAVGAVVLGFSVGLAAGTRAIFTEREDNKMSLRRGFEVRPEERVLVVEDVVTTGGSAREVVDLVKGTGAEVVGVGALIDRDDPARRNIDFGVPFHALLALQVSSWEQRDCPLCAQGTPLEDPGSRRLGGPG